MKSKSMIPMVLGAALWAGCAADPIRTNTQPDAGGGGGGGGDEADAAPVSNRITDGLVALYDFNEATGTIVGDSSGVGTALDLTIADPATVTWGAGFVTATAPSLITSAGPASKIFDACVAANAISVEAWVKPATIDNNGRIMSIGADANNHNVALVQPAGQYAVRLRTAATDANGNPDVVSNAGTAKLAVQHVVYSRQSTGLVDVFIDNVEQNDASRAGTLGNWVNTYTLTLANEPSNDRPYLGDIYLVAVYCKALSASEVATNYAEGY